MAADAAAEEDERHWSKGHVLVDACEAHRLDNEPDLLLDLPRESLGQTLAHLEGATRQLPALGHAAANRQGAAGVVHDDPGHSHHVTGESRHLLLLDGRRCHESVGSSASSSSDSSATASCTNGSLDSSSSASPASTR